MHRDAAAGWRGGRCQDAGHAAAFKSWLRQISQHVAEASNEGGFLGIGGVPVSEAEKATLTEISSAPKLAA